MSILDSFYLYIRLCGTVDKDEFIVIDDIRFYFSTVAGIVTASEPP